jgi:endonuclease/exonuclease/phosphatase family metal-dependent hydrolase
MLALQFLEAKEQMDAFISEKDVSVFWVGDFNIIAGSQAYLNDLALLDGAMDTFDANKSNYTGTNRSMTDRIDYIFNIGKIVTSYSVITDLFGTNLEVTDHLGVVGGFEI